VEKASSVQRVRCGSDIGVLQFLTGRTRISPCEALIGRDALGYEHARLTKDEDRQTAVLLVDRPPFFSNSPPPAST
jgi:hypothetical protein